MPGCIIKRKEFQFVENALLNEVHRESYFELTKEIFKLDFHPWYESGFFGNVFTPYTLYDGGKAVASVGVVDGSFISENKEITYAQISTVMTLPAYRGMNLNKYLLDYVLEQWRDKRDMVYLYANDSVLDYYPKFGFETAVEYCYSIPVSKKEGRYRKLDLLVFEDRELLIKKYELCNNPFSALRMKDNLSMLMFHCITFLHDNIYYVEELDAVVMAKIREDSILCYDIYTDAQCRLYDILAILATEQIKTAYLGFMPKEEQNCICEPSTEKDTAVFVLDHKSSVFFGNKVTLPFLSKA